MTLTDLTWDDLTDWAGDRIVGRGKSYRRRVEHLCVTADGSLLAWVQGNNRYATTVSMNTEATLSSQCTCPFSWGPCKHAVAVILAYLHAMKNGQAPARSEPNDQRLMELAEAKDAMEDEDDGVDALRGLVTQRAREDELLRNHLQAKSKKELVDLLMAGGDIIPDLRRRLLDQADLRDGKVAKLIASARKEIDETSREPAWTNHWRGESQIPEYSGVRKRLENLLAAGHADAVVELGSHLMERGIAQVEQSHDEGETGREISEAMEIIFRALDESSLSLAQRILWEIDLRLQDDYCILDGVSGPCSAVGSRNRDAWTQVADGLKDRLTKMPTTKARDRDEFSTKYARERVMRWLLTALERAGREAEVIPVLEREAAHTDCYCQLVERLISAGEIERAREWARKGFIETQERAPGIAWDLEAKLRELAERDKNAPLAAAYRAAEFFYRPGIESYTQLQKAATKAKVWDAVRKAALSYLETGRRPDIANGASTRTTRKNRGQAKTIHKTVSPSPVWPLPCTELPLGVVKERGSRYPDRSTLVDIAIEEARHEDALQWYRAGSQQNWLGDDHVGRKVAEAVQESHPDEALAIWKQMVARELVHAKPAAYQTAGAYLKKIKAVYRKTRRTSEWSGYLAEIREQNARRPRMLDVLNKLEGRRTRIMDA